MIKISKEVAKKLNSEYGVPFGENGISRTHNKSHHYFLCTSEYNLTNLLKLTQHDEAQMLLDNINRKKTKYKNKN